MRENCANRQILGTHINFRMTERHTHHADEKGLIRYGVTVISDHIARKNIVKTGPHLRSVAEPPERRLSYHASDLMLPLCRPLQHTSARLTPEHELSQKRQDDSLNSYQKISRKIVVKTDPHSRSVAEPPGRCNVYEANDLILPSCRPLLHTSARLTPEQTGSSK